MKKYIWLIAIIIIFIVFGYSIKYFYNYVLEKKEIMEKSIEELKQTITPIKLKIIDKKQNRLYFILKFYDLDNNSVGIFTDSIYGDYLFIDFKVLKIQDRYLFFPVTIFSDKIPSYLGIDLTNHYETDNYPKIYLGENISENFRNLLKYSWLYITNRPVNKEKIDFEFGNALHTIKKIEKIDKETIYSYVCHTKKGGIEIIEK